MDVYELVSLGLFFSYLVEMVWSIFNQLLMTQVVIVYQQQICAKCSVHHHTRKYQDRYILLGAFIIYYS